MIVALLGIALAACEGVLAVSDPCPLQAKSEAVRPLALVAGDLLHVQVEVLGADLRLELRRPDGTRLRRANERAAGDGTEELWWISSESSPALLAIQPLAGIGGAYRVVAVESRPATDADRERVDAIAGALAMREAYLAADPTGSRELASRGVAVAQRLLRLGLADRALDVLYERSRGLQQDLHDDAGARRALAELVEQARALGLPARLADALAWQAVDARRTGHLAEAERLAVEAVAEARRSGDRRVLADAVDVEAGVVEALGRSVEAEALAREAIALQTALGRVDSAARGRTSLGHVLFRRGQLDAAAAEFELAGDAFARLGRPISRVLALANLGAVLISKGESERAVERLEEALALPFEGGPAEHRIRALLNLGNAYRDLGRRAQAEARARQAEAEAREADLPELRGIALEDMGELAAEAGRLQNADRRYAESLAIERTIGDPEHLSATLARAGDVARRLRRFDGSREQLAEALALAGQHGYLPRELDSRYRLALLDRDTGDLVGALAEAARAIVVAEKIRAGLAAETDRASYLATVRDLYHLEVELQLDLDRRRPRGGHLEAAFAAAERGRARWLLDLLDPARAPRPNALAAQLRERAARLRDVQRRLFELRFPSAVDPDRRALEREETAAAAALVETRAALDRSRPASTSLAFEAVRSDDVRAVLAPDEALLEYVIGAERATVFVVRPDRLVARRLAPPVRLARAVSALLVEATRPSLLGAASYRDRAARADALLLGPVLPELAGVRRLFVSADGPLHRLPFGLLVDAAGRARSFPGLAYRARRFDIVRIPSASAWRELATRPERRLPTRVAAAFGDPALPAAESAPARRRAILDLGTGDLRPLPSSRQEVEEIGRCLPGAEVYVGERASEATVKRDPAVAGSRVLHFATHGIASDRDPSFSALLLAPGSSDEDGLLQAWEIEDLDLAAELVVLAACRSAQGREVSGEGFVGLTQAFVDGGARGVVASLWSVDDRATARLMRELYRRLAQGETPSAALTHAQRTMIARGGLDAHPARWAPFIVLGAPRPIVGPTTPTPAR